MCVLLNEAYEALSSSPESRELYNVRLQAALDAAAADDGYTGKPLSKWLVGHRRGKAKPGETRAVFVDELRLVFFFLVESFACAFSSFFLFLFLRSHLFLSFFSSSKKLQQQQQQNNTTAASGAKTASSRPPRPSASSATTAALASSPNGSTTKRKSSARSTPAPSRASTGSTRTTSLPWNTSPRKCSARGLASPR